MKAKAQAKMQRTSRSRVVALLCAIGLIATGLGQSLLSASADDQPVPGEQVTPGPTQITQAAPASADQSADATSTTKAAAQHPASTTPAPAAAAPAQRPAIRLTPRPRVQQSAPTTAASSAATSDPQQRASTAAPHAGAKSAATTATKTAKATKAACDAPDHAKAAVHAKTTSFDSTGSDDAATNGSSADTDKAQAGGVVGSSADTDKAQAGGVVGSTANAESARSGCQQKQARPASRAIARPSDSAAMPAAEPLRNAGGLPTTADPTTSLALPGAVPVGVPNFFIEKFRIPPFLLPIYQAAGTQYGIRWEVLAAINEIETDYGRNLNVSSAGALGWMQFMPSTWKKYGVDANRDGKKDPFNPVDAIFAAARYLKAAGGDKNLRAGIFAYNHADWYVDSVLMRARMIGGLPDALIGSLTGLTQGHFPVYAKARYADDLSEHDITRRVKAGQNAAMPIESSASRRSIDIYAADHSPVIAVQDGRIVATGHSKRLGRFVRLRDAYGNTYTYSQLGSVASQVPVPKSKSQSQASIARELALPKADPKPTAAATAGRQLSRRAARKARAAATAAAAAKASDDDVTADATPPATKERLFAHPARRNALRHGGRKQLLDTDSSLADGASLKSYFAGDYGLARKDVVLEPLAKGRRVIAGTILGRIATISKTQSPHVTFEIRPAGRGAPRIDPKPILDGWKLLESTAIYRVQGKNALIGPDAPGVSIGQILLMSKEALAQRVLADPRIEIYSCGRRDIESGQIDRRVLATLEFLAGSGLDPTVSALKCGHSYLTTSGNVSEHSSGNAVDIAKVNGIPILGHQGEGSITDITIRRLLTLQGPMKPHQIISLMTYAGTDNTLSLPDHADHIHVGFHTDLVPGSADSRRLDAVLKPKQWIALIARLGQIDNPTVSVKPSKYAIPAPVRRASVAHQGE